MRISLSALLTVISAALAQPVPQWFHTAKFGVRLGPGVSLEQAAKSGARYVVAPEASENLKKDARRLGIQVLDSTDVRTVKEWIPSSTRQPCNEQEPHWEAEFSVSDESGGETSEELIRLLIEVASKGGNLLLAVPPDSRRGLEALEAVGRWLKANGESIFETRQSPFDRMPFFGCATTKGNVLYVHLFDWPKDRKLNITGLQNEITGAELLNGKAGLKWSGTVVELPDISGGEAASVVKLSLSGPARVKPYIIGPDAGGIITAHAQSCEFETRPGRVIRKASREGRVFLSHWTRAIDVPTWKVQVPRDGRYAVEMVYRAGKESDGVLYTVTMKGPTMGVVKGTVRPTGSETRRFRTSDMELEAGYHMLFVQPENKPGQPAMELESVRLWRIGE